MVEGAVVVRGGALPVCLMSRRDMLDPELLELEELESDPDDSESEVWPILPGHLPLTACSGCIPILWPMIISSASRSSSMLR